MTLAEFKTKTEAALADMGQMYADDDLEEDAWMDILTSAMPDGESDED